MDFQIQSGCKLQVSNVSVQETGQIVFFCHLPDYSVDQLQLVKSELEKHNYTTEHESAECVINDLDKMFEDFSQLKIGDMYFVYSKNEIYEGHHRAVLVCKNSINKLATFWYPDFGYYEIHDDVGTVKAKIEEEKIISLKPAVIAVKLGELSIKASASNLSQLRGFKSMEIFINRILNQETVMLGTIAMTGLSIQSVRFEKKLKDLKIIENGLITNCLTKQTFSNNHKMKIASSNGLNFYYNSKSQTKAIAETQIIKTAQFNLKSDLKAGDIVLYKLDQENIHRCQILCADSQNAFMVSLDSGMIYVDKFGERIREIDESSQLYNMPRQVYACTFQDTIMLDPTQYQSTLDCCLYGFAAVDKVAVVDKVAAVDKVEDDKAVFDPYHIVERTNDTNTNALGYIYVKVTDKTNKNLKSILLSTPGCIQEVTRDFAKVLKYSNRTLAEHETVVTYIDQDSKILHAKVQGLAKSRNYEKLNNKLNKFYRNSKNNQTETAEFLPGRFIAFEFMNKSGNCKNWRRGEIMKSYSLSTEKNPFMNSELQNVVVDVVDCETGEVHLKMDIQNCRHLAKDFTAESGCYIAAKIPKTNRVPKIGEKLTFIVGYSGEYILKLEEENNSGKIIVQNRSKRDYLQNQIKFQDILAVRQFIHDSFIHQNYQKVLFLVFNEPTEKQVCDINNGQFYICNREMFKQRSELEKRMEKYFEDYQPPGVPLKAGKPLKGMHVLAKSNGKYFRGVYLNAFDDVKEGSVKFKILHIDYGNYGWYSSKELFILETSLTDISPCTILIELQDWQKMRQHHYGVSSQDLFKSLSYFVNEKGNKAKASWLPTKVTSLDETVENFLGYPYIVTAKVITCDGMNIIDEMMECPKLLGSTKEKIAEDFFAKISDVEQTEVEPFEAHELKFVKFCKNTLLPNFTLAVGFEEHLKSIQKELIKFYEGGMDLKEPIIDQIVVVKLGFGKFIRAKIVDITVSAGKVEVQDIDCLDVHSADFSECKTIKKTDPVLNLPTKALLKHRITHNQFEADFKTKANKLKSYLNQAESIVYYDSNIYCKTMENQVLNVDSYFHYEDEVDENYIPEAVKKYFGENRLEDSEEPEVISPESYFIIDSFIAKYSSGRIYENLMSRTSAKEGVIITNCQRDTWNPERDGKSVPIVSCHVVGINDLRDLSKQFSDWEKLQNFAKFPSNEKFPIYAFIKRPIDEIFKNTNWIKMYTGELITLRATIDSNWKIHFLDFGLTEKYDKTKHWKDGLIQVGKSDLRLEGAV